MSPTFNINRPGASTTTKVTGLNAGATYDCYAIAKNWDGSAVCSSTSAVTLNKDSGKPTISAVATTALSQETSIDVTWTAGTDSSPAATGTNTFYVACVASAGATCPTGVTFDVARPAGRTTATVGGLTPGASCACYVVAKNWNGEEVCSSGADLNPFYLDTNSVTVKCPGVAVGAAFPLGAVPYPARA
ncbi:MAG: hypothetical protein GY754_14950, partial [bacterium]|nr:hypothetical protein [bacterium]